MYTFAETPTFVAEADKLWSEDERLEFFTWSGGWSRHSREWWLSQGSLVPCRHRQAWRRSSHLLHSLAIG